MEVGRASFDTQNKHFVLLDAPGHKSFVPNMIGGAAQADLGVLVCSFKVAFSTSGDSKNVFPFQNSGGKSSCTLIIGIYVSHGLNISLSSF